MTRARDNSFNPFNNQAAGKNFVINGAMDHWQRGTSITRTTYAETFLADRWYASAGGPFIASRESSIVPAGFQYSHKIVGNGSNYDPFMTHIIETQNAILLAGQTVTLSAYVYASTNIQLVNLLLSSSTVTDDTRGAWSGSFITATRSGSTSVGPSWQRISSTFTVPSNAKTLMVQIQVPSQIASSTALYFTGVQLEQGSTPTQFSRAGGTIGGELALCQRYYQRWSTNNWYAGYMTGYSDSTTTGSFVWQLVNTMRANPTFAASSASVFLPWTTGNMAITQIAVDSVTTNSIAFYVTYNSTVTAGQGVRFRNYADNTSFLEAVSEL